MKHIFIIKESMPKDFINQIISLMQGYHYEFCFTKTIEDAYKIAYRYRNDCKTYRFYAVGGDGFVHQIANAIYNTHHELVVIPSGTGNDYARSLYSSLDPFEILKESLTLKVQKVDVMMVNDIVGVNVVCCGLDAYIANDVHDHKQKWLPQSGQYIYQIMKKLVTLPSFHLKISCHQEVLFDGDVIIGAFCKQQYYGGGFYIGYHISEGMIDIEIVEKLKKRELLVYGQAFLKHRLDKMEKYHHFLVDSCTIETSQGMNIDGEVYKKGQYQLKVLPKALRVVKSMSIDK